MPAFFYGVIRSSAEISKAGKNKQDVWSVPVISFLEMESVYISCGLEDTIDELSSIIKAFSNNCCSIIESPYIVFYIS